MAENEIIYGVHPVLEALRSGRNVGKIYVRQGLEGLQLKEIMDAATARGLTCQFVPAERLNKMAKGAHQGVAATIAQVEPIDLEELVNNALAQSEAPIFVILDGVSDVRNFGAIARTLECAGGNGIILPAKGGAALNSDAVKTSAGALMRLDVCRVSNLKYAAYYLKQSGFRLIAATEKVEKALYDADMTGPIAIVMGSEGKGISKLLLELCDEKVSIPMAGEISSLNVSVAASVMLYEAVRQRRN